MCSDYANGSANNSVFNLHIRWLIIIRFFIIIKIFKKSKLHKFSCLNSKSCLIKNIVTSNNLRFPWGIKMKPDLQKLYIFYMQDIHNVCEILYESIFIINKEFKVLITPNFNLCGLKWNIVYQCCKFTPLRNAV